MSGPASFDDLVSSRAGSWWRLAWLLTGESTRARQLVDLALARVWPRWSGLDRAGGWPEASVRRELVAAYLDINQPKRRRDPSAAPEPGALDPVVDVLGPERTSSLDDERARVLAALALLEPDQRAAVVLSRSPDLSTWDAADALDVTPDRLAALAAEAESVVVAAVPRGGELMARVTDVVPDPEYDSAQAVRARALAGTHRRRRRVRAGLAIGVLVTLVTVSLLVGQEPASPPAAGTSTAGDVAAAESLIDPLPIPDRCAELPHVPGPPDLPYDPDGAIAVWLRFCPAPGVAALQGAVAFAPDTTLVAQELDDLVDGLVTAGPAPARCRFVGPAVLGTLRAQVGTLDGALHVAEFQVAGRCGFVTLDGRELRVDGRAAFADVVRLLGAELIGQVDDPGLAVAEPAFCPDQIAEVARFSRTTVQGYPQVPGLPLPLPATGAMVCGYPAGPGTWPGVGPGEVATEEAPKPWYVDPATAELLRAAYLARLTPPTGCEQTRPGDSYAVVVTDGTDSRRAFTVDFGGCATVRGPGGAVAGRAGPWLTGLLGVAPPRGFGQRLNR